MNYTTGSPAGGPGAPSSPAPSQADNPNEAPEQLMTRLRRAAGTVLSLQVILIILGFFQPFTIALTIASCCAYRAASKPNVRSLRFFAACNILAAVLLVALFITALAIGVPVMGCACKKSCVNSVYDVVQDWDNRTANATWLDVANQLNMTGAFEEQEGDEEDADRRLRGGLWSRALGEAAPAKEEAVEGEPQLLMAPLASAPEELDADGASCKGSHGLLEWAMGHHNRRGHRRHGWRHDRLQALHSWFGFPSQAANVTEGQGRVTLSRSGSTSRPVTWRKLRYHREPAQQLDASPDVPQKYAEEDDKYDEIYNEEMQSDVEELDDPGQAWLARVVGRIQGMSRIEFQRAARHVCGVSRGIVIAAPFVFVLLLAVHIRAASTASRLSKHPWYIAQDQARRQLRRARRMAEAAAAANNTSMPPALQYWYSQAASTTAPPAANPAVSPAGNTVVPAGGSQPGETAPNPNMLYRYVPGSGFVAMPPPPPAVGFAPAFMPPGAYGQPALYAQAVPPMYPAQMQNQQSPHDGEFGGDIAQAVRTGLRAGSNMISGLASRVLPSRGYETVPSYDSGEPQQPSFNQRPATTVVISAPNLASGGGYGVQQPPPPPPPGSAAAYSYGH